MSDVTQTLADPPRRVELVGGRTKLDGGWNLHRVPRISGPDDYLLFNRDGDLIATADSMVGIINGLIWPVTTIDSASPPEPPALSAVTNEDLAVIARSLVMIAAHCKRFTHCKKISHSPRQSAEWRKIHSELSAVADRLAPPNKTEEATP